MLVVYWFRCKNIDVFWVLFGGFLVSVKLGYLHVVIKSQKYEKTMDFFFKLTLCNIFNTSNKQTVAQYMYIWMFIWKTQTHCRVDDVWHCWSLLGQSDGRAFADLELMQRQNHIFLGENCKCYCSTLGRPAASAQPHCNTVIIWGDYGRRMGCGMH